MTDTVTDPWASIADLAEVTGQIKTAMDAIDPATISPAIKALVKRSYDTKEELKLPLPSTSTFVQAKAMFAAAGRVNTPPSTVRVSPLGADGKRLKADYTPAQVTHITIAAREQVGRKAVEPVQAGG